MTTASNLMMNAQTLNLQDNNIYQNYPQMDNKNIETDFLMMGSTESEGSNSEENINFLAKGQQRESSKADKLKEDMNSMMNILMTLAILDPNFDASKLFCEEKTSKKNVGKDRNKAKDFQINNKMNFKGKKKSFDKMIPRVKTD